MKTSSLLFLQRQNMDVYVGIASRENSRLSKWAKT